MKRITALLLLAAMLLCGCTATPVYTPTGDALHQDDMTKPSSTQPIPQLQALTFGYYPDRSLNPYTSTEHAVALTDGGETQILVVFNKPF